MHGSKEMAPTKTGANDGEENSPRSSGVKKFSPRGEGRPLSPAAASAPNYDGGDGGRSADSPRSGKEMAPMKTGAKDGGENSQRSSARKRIRKPFSPQRQ